ncbi:hypothetical protein Tco_1396172 [Tanacetum coccineum]
MEAGQRKPETQWIPEDRKAANLDQRLKSLIMFVLPDDQMNSVINCLTEKSTWDDLILYHEGPSDVKESRVMDLKLCYNTFKFKEGESLTQTFTRYKVLMNELVNNGIILLKLEINIGFVNGLPKKWLAFCQSLKNINHVKESELASLFEFQDSPDEEEDTRSSQEYINDLEEEYQARDLLAKSKRFFKKEEVSSDDNEVTEVKARMALANEDRVFVDKESAKNEAWLNSSNKVNRCINEQIPTQKKKILGIDQLTEDTSSSGPKYHVFVKSSVDNSKVSITGSNKTKLSEAKDSTLSNHDTGKYTLPPLEKLTSAELVSGPKTIKSILKSKSTFKAETLKGFIINEPSSAPARGNKVLQLLKLIQLLLYHTGQGESSSRSRPSRPAIHFPSCIHCGYNYHKYDDCVYYPICEICGSYDHDTHGHNRIISLRRGIKHRNPQHVTKNCETCGGNVHTTYDHNDIEWFKKREALQAKRVESFKASKTESSSALRSKTPTKK